MNNSSWYKVSTRYKISQVASWNHYEEFVGEAGEWCSKFISPYGQEWYYNWDDYAYYFQKEDYALLFKLWLK